MKTPIAFIISYNRPIFLWVTLDSLYRKTSKNIKFILIDNNSNDPLVKNVIEGFKRRNMFHKVYMMNTNSKENFLNVFNNHKNELGDYFFTIESDVEVITKDWDKKMIKNFTSDNYGILGSAVDKDDFINPDSLKEKSSTNNFLIKANSPERKYELNGNGIINVFPPGRITIRKTEIILSNINNIDKIYNDSDFTKTSKSLGYKIGIIKEIKHRHLSLLNYYDYHNYDKNNRNKFFK
jgi:hypothetical protein